MRLGWKREDTRDGALQTHGKGPWVRRLDMLQPPIAVAIADRVFAQEEWVIARTINLRASRCRRGCGVVHHPSLSLFPVRHRHPRLQTWQVQLCHVPSSVSSIVSFPPTHPAGSVRLPTVPRTALPSSPLSLSNFSFRCLLFSCRVTPSRHASPHRSDLERRRQPVSTDGERRSTSSLAPPPRISHDGWVLPPGANEESST